MIFKGRLRERAIAIETKASALIEKYGHGACEVAHDMERQANDLGTTLFWHAVRKVILARSSESQGGAEVLPPVRTGNCVSCLVDKFFRHEWRRATSAGLRLLPNTRIRGRAQALKLEPDQVPARALSPTQGLLWEPGPSGDDALTQRTASCTA